jgi:fluoride exporter
MPGNAKTQLKGTSFMIEKLAWLALAGSAGTLSRYGLAGLVSRIAGISFPWGTLTVNLTGCFLAGFLWTLFENRLPVSGEIRIIIMMGFIGSFTTFSTLLLETGILFRSQEWMYAIANLSLHNGLGFVALIVGFMIGRLL